MNRGELRTRARQLLFDEAQPYGWADTELNAYINEALRQACVRGQLLRRLDTVTLVSGTASYDLPDYFDPWQVTRVYLSSTPEIEVTKRSRPELIREYQTYDLGSGTPIHYRLDGPNESAPFGLVLFPTPDATDTLNIEYIALPCDLSTDTSTPEISTYYHEKLLDGVLMLCYRKKDADAYDPDSALKHEAMFTRSFGTDYSALEHNHIQQQQHYVVIPE